MGVPGVPAVSTGPGRGPPPVRGYQPLVGIAVAVGAGIVVDRVWPQAVLPWSLSACAGLAVWVCGWRLQCPRIASIALLAGAAGCGAAWHHACWCLYRPDDVGNYTRADPQPVCLEVVACGAPRRIAALKPDPLRMMPSGPRARFHVAVESIRDGIVWRRASGRVLVQAEGIVEGVRSGDRLRLCGQLVQPPAAQNPGQFDYRNSLRADRCRAVLRVSHPEGIAVLRRCSWWNGTRVIDAVRAYGARRLDELFDRDQSGVLAAVLLGAREQLDPEQTAAFLETGTIHLMVVSGLNVALLALAAGFVLRRIWRGRVGVTATVAALAVFYMLLTDAEPPVVRATVLVLGAAVAIGQGRTSSAFNTLGAAALVVLALNPTDVFNVGAQLSFLSVAGLAWLAVWHAGRTVDDDSWAALERAFPRPLAVRAARRGMAVLRDMLVVSTVIWLLVGPLVLARFHLFTPVAPLVNVLVCIPMNVATVGGFALLALGWLPGAGAVLAAGCSWSLSAMEMVVEAGRRVPWGHLWGGGPADWWIAGFYAAVAAMAALPPLRPRWSRRWALLGLWTAVGLLAGAGKPHQADLTCTVLSVGHGCAVVLECPGGKTFLYDAGQMGAPQSAARTIAGYLWSRGITRLDGIFLSHADLDHFNALPELLKRFSVSAVLVSPLMFRQQNPAAQAVQAAMAEAAVPQRCLQSGDRWSFGDTVIDVLHPPSRGIAGTPNANSLVLRISCRGDALLLPGDLDSVGLETLLTLPPQRCRVLLAPHHGSRRSRAAGLLTWCQPDWVIISGARDRGFAAITEQFRQSGLRWLHTASSGAVRIRLGGTDRGAESFVPEPPRGRGVGERPAEAQRPGLGRPGVAGKTLSSPMMYGSFPLMAGVRLAHRSGMRICDSRREQFGGHGRWWSLPGSVAGLSRPRRMTRC